MQGQGLAKGRSHAHVKNLLLLSAISVIAID